MALTPKQKRFIDELMVDENAKQAAIRAGYSPKSAEVNGPRLCRQLRPHIEAARKELVQRTQLRQEDVIAELKRVAFLDPRLVYGADGRPLPVKDMPEDVARAVAEVSQEVEVEPDRETDDGMVVKGRARAEVKKLVFASKIKALELAMKHLGMLTDKVEHSGKDGGPLEVTVKLVREVAEEQGDG